MATIRVCDGCGNRLDERDFAPIIVASGGTKLEIDTSEKDICRYCLADAAKNRDDRPKVYPSDWPHSLCYLVTLKGVRTPGPHAAFAFKDDVAKYIEGKDGAAVQER